MKEKKFFLWGIIIGIVLRFFMMSLGYNFDFESYCIVGEIAGHFRNVYAETTRYNYGPIFFMIQGLLYRIAEWSIGETMLVYRVLIVSVLICVDAGIAYFIANRYSERVALSFFLNPVSIFISGFHNQFDNIAVLLALVTILFYNEEKEINRKDIGFLCFMSLCLMTKHILFIFPLFILLRKSLSMKKRLVYACVPPFVFLVSFVPFVINNQDAFRGVIKNVFFYRSFNNMPLLLPIYSNFALPEKSKFLIFIGLMMLMAFVTRKYDYEKQMMIYLISLVVFSSAVANQYLAIPLVALCVLNTRWFMYLYSVLMGMFLLLSRDGLGLYREFSEGTSHLSTVVNHFVGTTGYAIAAWILLVLLCKIIIEGERDNTI